MMKKTVFSIFTVLLTLIGFSQTIWVPQNSGTNSSLTDIQFINDSVGWASGPGIVLHTNDGGESWITQDSVVGAMSLFFIDSNLGFKCNQQKIYKTQDGGNTWNQIYSLPESSFSTLRDIYFTDSLKGWTVGGFYDPWYSFLCSSGILHTIDGGKNWEWQYGNSGRGIRPFNNIYFKNKQDGFACGGYLRGLFYTLNSGNTWELDTLWPQENISILDVFFIDESFGWLSAYDEGLGDPSTVFRTDDGGTSWKYSVLEGGVHLESICFTDKMNGWVAGYNDSPSTANLYYTDDGGISWSSNLVPDLTSWLRKIFFSKNKRGWVVGSEGIILTCQSTAAIPDPLETSKINFFPNPVSERLNIHIENILSKNLNISLVNSIGQVIYNRPYSTSTNALYTSINTRGFPEGIYFLIIDQQNGKTVEKVIVSR